MKNALVWFCFLFSISVHAAATAPQKDFPSNIIDMHTHVACIENEEPKIHDESGPGDRCYVSDQMKNTHLGMKYKLYLKAFGISPKDIAKEGKTRAFENLTAKLESAKRVKKAVVLGLDGYVERESGAFNWEKTQVYVPNSFVLEGMKKRPDLFYYGPSINPYRKDALERLRQAYADGAVLVKWIPSTMNIDPSDPSLEPFYEEMKKLGLPLLVHTGKESTFAWAEDDNCDPALLEYPLKKGVKVIAAHVATCGEHSKEKACDRLKGLFLAPRYKGLLFADISATTQTNRVRSLREILKDDAFKGRLIYGTDWPLIDVRLLGYMSLSPYTFYMLPHYLMWWYSGPWISFGNYQELNSIPNTLDRDVRLKEMFGAAPEIFTKAEEVLRFPN